MTSGQVASSTGRLARLGLVLDRARDAVRAEHRHRARRHLGQFLDEHRALRPQRVDDVAVVDDLVAHIDRRAVAIERALDDLDRADHAGAKTAGLGENHLDHQYLQRGCHRIVVLSRLRKMAART